MMMVKTDKARNVVLWLLDLNGGVSATLHHRRLSEVHRRESGGDLRAREVAAASASTMMVRIDNA